MKYLQTLPFILSYAVAIPTIAPPPPTCAAAYIVENQTPVEGDMIVGDYTVSGGSDLNDGSTFSIGVTVAVGFDLGLDFGAIVGGGLSAQVSTTTTTATTQGATVPCPDGPWKCALAIFPQMLEVSGEKQIANRPCNPAYNVPVGPYTVQLPVEGDSGGIKARIEICACKNYDHYDDEGAPSIVCDTCPQ